MQDVIDGAKHRIEQHRRFDSVDDNLLTIILTHSSFKSMFRLLASQYFVRRSSCAYARCCEPVKLAPIWRLIYLERTDLGKVRTEESDASKIVVGFTTHMSTAKKKVRRIPFDFVLEELEHLDPVVRPMFGCEAVYVGEKIVLILRLKEDSIPDNGIWIATTLEHHQSLKKTFPSLKSIDVFGQGVTGWQVLPSSSLDFEESAIRVCELILSGDERIGKVPKRKAVRPRATPTRTSERRTPHVLNARRGVRVKNSQNGFTVESHFAEKDPVVQKIYNKMLKAVRRLGPVTEEAKKTSIHLVNKTALAGVATRKAHMILTVKSDRKLAGPRIHKTAQVSAHRFYHEIKLTSPEEIDPELIGWLKAAHALSGKSKD